MPPPNLVLLITDQQRAAQHWPDDPGWLRSLMPNDSRLADSGLAFDNAFCNTCMCSPSRATLLTGLYPTQHGVPLTLTRGDLWPDVRNFPGVVRAFAAALRSGEADRRRAARTFVRGAARSGPRSGDEPELSPSLPTLAHLLRGAGYHVALKGKWHLTKPLGEEWEQRDAARLEEQFGISDWEPPDAGEDAKAEHFGGGGAGASGEGFDEDFVRSVERWLDREDLPEPFCLIVSLVNPHDVLGYPATYEAGGYDPGDWRDLDVPLPPTVDEDLSNKPSVHALMRMGQAAYLGGLGSHRARHDYVGFYAHLHRLVDSKIGRVLDALGDAQDASSLRSRTVVVRVSDHGEMGLSHGGLRQKMFNAYEETIRVPLVISHPALFKRGARTAALASLVDVLPTMLTLAGVPQEGLGLRGRDLSPVLARHLDVDRELLTACGVDLSALTQAATPGESVQDSIHFTYDDHQAGTALQNVAGQPNRVRCVRDARYKHAVYLDPAGAAAPEYELYDLERDPYEASNLVSRSTGAVIDRSDEGARAAMAELLEEAIARCGTALPPS